MFRRFLRHKIIRDKDLLLTFPKPPLFPRLLPRTSVGNVIIGLSQLPVLSGFSRFAGCHLSPPRNSLISDVPFSLPCIKRLRACPRGSFPPQTGDISDVPFPLP